MHFKNPSRPTRSRQVAETPPAEAAAAVAPYDVGLVVILLGVALIVAVLTVGGPVLAMIGRG